MNTLKSSLAGPHADRSVLLVIPTLNEAANIANVISSLTSGYHFNGHSRIIVVDGGSTDGTTDIVRSLMSRNDHLMLLHNPLRIQSAAVNLAVRTFGKNMEVLIRCDAHAQYPPDFVQRLLLTMDQTDCDAVVVAMDSVSKHCLGRAIAWLSDSLVGSGGSAHRGGRMSGYVDHGHHAAFRLDTFCIVGGYDESFRCNEDAEFDARQRAIGAKIYLDGANRILYQPRHTLTGLWHQYFGYGVGRSRTMRKHPGSVRLRQLAVPANSVLCLICLLLSIWMPVLLILPTAYLSVIGFSASMLAVRHQSWCAFGAIPAAVTMHFAWSLGFFKELLRIRELRWAPAMLESLAR